MAKLNKKLLTEFSEKFLGYGNIKAPIWFIGMEPGSPDNPNLLESFFNVWINRGKHEIDDVKESHIQIGHHHYTKFFEEPIKYQKTWGGLIKILFAIKGEKTFNKEKVKSYQKEKLGRLNSNHCLLELFALPTNNIKPDNWYKYYNNLKMTKKDYIKEYKSNRISKIKTLIIINKPKIVVFYGTSYKEYWKEIAKLNNEQTKIFENKRIYYYLNSQTKYIICNHPVARGITNEYLIEVGKLVIDLMKS